MLQSYKDVFTDVPGSTNIIQHIIMLSDDKHVVVHQYPLPLHYEDAAKKKLTQLLNTGLVEKANSQYSAPFLPVKKTDGMLRLCVDYRLLNQVTLVQLEPMPNPENMFPFLARPRLFSKFDISKGYYQFYNT